MSHTLDLLKKLVSIPSITPKDGGCLDLIDGTLAPLGFQSESFNTSTVSNRWYTHGQGAPVLVFLGHVDVVPPGPRERWATDPFEPIEKDGYLHGRGTADMKGGVSAMVVACADFVRQHPDHRGTVALLLTSDEEGPALEGTILALNALVARGQSFDYGVVGEPTCTEHFGDVIKNGRRGSLTAKLRVIGKQGHVAYPHKAVNAVHRALPVILELTQMTWDQGNGDFPPTTMQIANVSAGTGTGNVIPGEIEFDINWRHGTASSTESLIKRTESLLAKHGLINAKDYVVEWQIGAKPYLTTGRTLIQALSSCIHETTGIMPRCETTGGTSDGRFLAEHCTEVVEFGTKNATIHQVNEKVAMSEVDQLKTIYQSLLNKILGTLNKTLE